MVMQLWHETARRKADEVNAYVSELLANASPDDKFLVFAFHRCGQRAPRVVVRAQMHCVCALLRLAIPRARQPHTPPPGAHTHPTAQHTPVHPPPHSRRELMDAIEAGVNAARKQPELKELRYMRIDGSTDARTRDDNVSRFQNDAACRVRAAGRGLCRSQTHCAHAPPCTPHLLMRPCLPRAHPMPGGHPQHPCRGRGPHAHARQHRGVCRAGLDAQRGAAAASVRLPGWPAEPGPHQCAVCAAGAMHDA